MAAHSPTGALEALRDYLNGVSELTGRAHYPVPGGALPSRAAAIRWRRFEKPDRETWLLTAEIDLTAPLLNEAQYDVSAIDPIVVAVVDAFDADARPAAYHLESGGDRVDRCDLSAGEGIALPGAYVFRLTADIKLRRIAP